MSADTILEYLSGCSHVNRLEFRVCVQCAPVLKGVKASNLITVAKGSLNLLRCALEGTEIVCVPLFSGEKTEVLLLYRHRALEKLLKQPEISGFLGSRGYEKMEVASVLLGIRRAYQAYSSGEREFPHELGVILEYPVADVADFIRYRGENCLFTGYWKVYHNPEQAGKRFRLYDRAKETAMRQMIDGCPLRLVVEAKGENNYE